MTITEFNHLAGYVLFFSFLLCMPDAESRLYNFFVVVCDIAFLAWASTSLFIIFG